MGPKERLNQYLERMNDTPFEWGVHDCLTFTNGAFAAYWGVGYADDWAQRYMTNGRPMRRDEMRREFGFGSIKAALDRRLQPCGAAIYGALVTTPKSQHWVTGVALGISVGSRCIFLGREGLMQLNSEDANGAWCPIEK